VLPEWVAPPLSLVRTFLVWFGYPIAFETAWSGGSRTPGEAALGLRVVTVEGVPLHFRHAAIRAALRLVDLRAPLGGRLKPCVATPPAAGWTSWPARWCFGSTRSRPLDGTGNLPCPASGQRRRHHRRQ
jgi:uncharacterized RDD family membrane protein YckC